MPFAKSNWECEPPIPKNGFFEFGQAYSVRNVTLRKGDHRPCFLHVSSEVECIFRTLSVVASVEILDLYALVGPMDSFDYRHVAKLQGTPVNPDMSLFAFRIDASVIPRDRVWQVQLKLSSGSQGIDTIVLQELSAQVERGHPDTGGAPSMEIMSLSASRGGASRVLTSPTTGGLGSSVTRGLSTSARAGAGSGGGARLFSPREEAARLASPREEAAVESSLIGTSSSRRALGSSRSSAAPALSSSTSGGLVGGGGASSLSTSRTAGAAPPSTGMASSGLSASVSRMARAESPPPRTSSRSSSMPLRSQQSRAMEASSSRPAAVVPRGNSSVMPSRGRSMDVARSSQSGSVGYHRGGGGGQVQLREETAAVASVLNAVCEKMVGVVSDKTKNYLFRAGRRTERRVLDKMQRLEERIERFDQVLERSSIKKIGQIEDAVLSLDSQMKSQSFSFTSPTTAAATPTSARST